MAGPNDFTGQNIQDTYQRVLQISSSGVITDGTGSIVQLTSSSIQTAVTASHALFAVSASHEITFELSSSHAVSADTASFATNFTASGNISASGDLEASNISSSGDINFTGTSGGIRLNGSGGFIIQSGQIVANQDIRTGDGKGIKFGVGSDYTIQHAGTAVDETKLTIKEGSTIRYTFGVGGHLTASSNVNIKLGQGGEFRGDSANITNITASNNISASGDIATSEKIIASQLDLEGGNVKYDASNNILKIADNINLGIGAGPADASGDLVISSDGTNATLQGNVGNVTLTTSAGDTIIKNNNVGGNIILQSDKAGSGQQGGVVLVSGSNAHVSLDVRGNITSSNNVKITGELELSDGNIRSDNNFDFLQLGGSAQQINIGKLGMSASYSAASTALSAMATSNAAVFGGDVSIGPSNNGKLGIGMLKPTSSLDITGDLRVSSHLTASGNISGSLNGTVSAGSGSFHILKGDTSQNTQLLVEGAITAIGSISSSGNISSSGGTVTAKQLTLDHASRVDIKFSNDGDEDHYIRKDGNFLRFRAHDDSTVLLELRNNTDGSNKTSFPNGNHGIGTNDPGEKLEVVGNISASGTITAGNITSSGNITASLNSKLFVSSASFGGASFLRSFNVKGAGLDGRLSLQGTAGTDNPGIEFTVNNNTSRALIRLDQVGTNGTALEFFTEPDGGDIANTLTIGHTGHITASGNISASGDIIATGTGSFGRLEATSTTALQLQNNQKIQFENAAGTEFGNIFMNTSDQMIFQNARSNKDIFIRAGNAGNEGNVIIQKGGTENVIAKFGVAEGQFLEGSLTASGNISSSGTLIVQKNQFSKTSNTDADHQGDVVFFGATTSMTAGKIYYYNSSGNWAETDADAEASAKGLLAVALGTASDTNGMLLRGTVTLNHDPGGVGDVLYLSTTAGQASSTVPSGNGDIVRIIGYCLDASNGQIWFNPDNTFVEVSA